MFFFLLRDVSSFSEADFEDFLNNLYNHGKSSGSGAAGDQNMFKGDSRRRKAKRKK